MSVTNRLLKLSATLRQPYAPLTEKHFQWRDLNRAFGRIYSPGKIMKIVFDLKPYKLGGRGDSAYYRWHDVNHVLTQRGASPRRILKVLRYLRGAEL